LLLLLLLLLLLWLRCESMRRSEPLRNLCKLSGSCLLGAGWQLPASGPSGGQPRQPLSADCPSAVSSRAEHRDLTIEWEVNNYLFFHPLAVPKVS
jgi:hypothetical protein